MAQPRSRTHFKEQGRAVTAYLLDPEVGWQSSQAGDTQAIDEYNKNTDFWNVPPTGRDSAEGTELTASLGDSTGIPSSRQRLVCDIDASAAPSASSQDLAVTGPVTPRPAVLRTRPGGRKTLYSPHWGLRRRADSASGFLTHRILRELRDLRKAQDSLDREFAVHLSRMQDLVSLQRQVLQAISNLADSDTKPDQGMVADEEEDPIPGSDWTLDPEEQSQLLIPRDTVTRRPIESRSPSPSQDPYTPSLESQVEAAIIGGHDVLGRPPCVSPGEWVKGRDSAQ
ncbi:hypothetical protein DFH06DRAFT_1202391 [Mycena polygramma]|nr:hypothetical protein DFH06DRAFT_1202391 [Mycena polygramma]